jgi:hypothetical protein
MMRPSPDPWRPGEHQLSKEFQYRTKPHHAGVEELQLNLLELIFRYLTIGHFVTFYRRRPRLATGV